MLAKCFMNEFIFVFLKKKDITVHRIKNINVKFTWIITVPMFPSDLINID